MTMTMNGDDDGDDKATREPWWFVERDYGSTRICV